MRPALGGNQVNCCGLIFSFRARQVFLGDDDHKNWTVHNSTSHIGTTGQHPPGLPDSLLRHGWSGRRRFRRSENDPRYRLGVRSRPLETVSALVLRVSETVSFFVPASAQWAIVVAIRSIARLPKSATRLRDAGKRARLRKSLAGCTCLLRQESAHFEARYDFVRHIFSTAEVGHERRDRKDRPPRNAPPTGDKRQQ